MKLNVHIQRLALPASPDATATAARQIAAAVQRQAGAALQGPDAAPALQRQLQQALREAIARGGRR